MKDESFEPEEKIYTEKSLNIAFDVQEFALLDLTRQRDEAMQRCQSLSGEALDNESDLVIKLDKEIRRVHAMLKNTSVNLNHLRPDENGLTIGG